MNELSYTKYVEGNVTNYLFESDYYPLTILFKDMASFKRPIFLEDICDVLDGKNTNKEVVGNMIELEIYSQKTLIVLQFPEGENINQIEIDTTELRQLIEEWKSDNAF